MKRTGIQPSWSNQASPGILEQFVPIIYYLNGNTVSKHDFETNIKENVEQRLLPYVAISLLPTFFSENGHLKERLLIINDIIPGSRLWAKAIHGVYYGNFKRELRIGKDGFPDEKNKDNSNYFY